MIDIIALEIGCELSLKHPDIFAQANKCLNLSDDFVAQLQKQQIKEGDLELYHFIYLFNFYKAQESLMSTTKLIDVGFIGDAQTICRKLIEQLINIKYLDQDKNNRQDRYWHFSAIELNKMISLVERKEHFTTKLKQEMKKLKPEAKKQLENAKKFYETEEDGQIKNNFRRNWSGLSLEGMSQKCKLEDLYDLCYRGFSTPTHAGIGNVSSFVEFDTKLFTPKYTLGTALKVLQEASRVYILLLQIIVNAFPQCEMKSINSTIEEINSFTSDKCFDDESPIWGIG